MKKTSNEKIFITGASGFLGRHLEKRLTNEGHSIFSDKIDLTNFSDLKKIISSFQPTIIYHLGAVVNLSRDFTIAHECIRVNIGGTLNLLEALRETKLKRFIYTSTVEVYGNTQIPYNEDQLPHPPSPYSVSKIAAEQLIDMYARENKFPYFVFRIATVYGPMQPSIRLIPQIIIRSMKNEKIELNSGTKKRDYVYIDDVLEVLLLAKKDKFKKDSGVINIGGGKTYTLKELVSMVLKKTKSTSSVVYGAFPDRVLEAEKWLLNNTRAKKIFGWRPKTTLYNGLTKMIYYYKDINV